MSLMFNHSKWKPSNFWWFYWSTNVDLLNVLIFSHASSIACSVTYQNFKILKGNKDTRQLTKIACCCCLLLLERVACLWFGVSESDLIIIQDQKYKNFLNENTIDGGVFEHHWSSSIPIIHIPPTLYHQNLHLSLSLHQPYHHQFTGSKIILREYRHRMKIFNILLASKAVFGAEKCHLPVSFCIKNFLSCTFVKTSLRIKVDGPKRRRPCESERS